MFDKSSLAVGFELPCSPWDSPSPIFYSHRSEVPMAPSRRRFFQGAVSGDSGGRLGLSRHASRISPMFGTLGALKKENLKNFYPFLKNFLKIAPKSNSQIRFLFFKGIQKKIKITLKMFSRILVNRCLCMQISFDRM